MKVASIETSSRADTSVFKSLVRRGGLLAAENEPEIEMPTLVALMFIVFTLMLSVDIIHEVLFLSLRFRSCVIT